MLTTLAIKVSRQLAPVSQKLAARTAIDDSGAVHIIRNVEIDRPAILAVQFVVQTFHVDSPQDRLIHIQIHLRLVQGNN